ncbi:MAG: hypoxanthine phosphoribosyltransferase [Bacteroidetes bacterium]|nr:MAG: hypoxanthine phosphoribosyltransferase [Bacteroidota bacterium]
MGYTAAGKHRILVKDRYFTKYIDSEEIQEAVQKLSDQIYADFKDEVPLFLCVLNGAFMFSSDFMKAYDGICELSFIRLASYKGTQTTEEVKTLIGLSEEIKGRSVIILEDIIDSGITISHLLSDLEKYEPAHLKVASLLLKPDALRTEIKPDYIGIEIPKDFIVGYGLDYDGFGRNLPDIYKILD